jgi:hypothetical protein
MPIRREFQVHEMAAARKARKRPVPKGALRVITPTPELAKAIREALPHHDNNHLERVQIVDENTAIVWNSVDQKRALARTQYA